MAGSSFDPKHAVRFDVANGTAHDSLSGRVLLVPCAALNDLAQIADKKAVIAFGHAIGRAYGARVASRLGGEEGVRAASLELVVNHLAGELSVAGVGLLSLERWGRALVVVVDNAAVYEGDLLESLIGGAIEAAAGRVVHAISLTRDEGTMRVLIASEAAVRRARELLSVGVEWGEVLTRLHGGAS